MPQLKPIYVEDPSLRHVKQCMQGTITLNDQEFTPIPNVNYRNDYVKILYMIADGQLDEKSTLRELVLKDLWFLVYFGLGVYVANHKFWVNACNLVQDGPKTNTLDIWAREHGKAIDYNYPVLTSEGWKIHGQLSVGDKVFHPSGKRINVIAVSEVFYNTLCYEVLFTDGSSVVCSGDHLWEVWKKSRRRISGTKNEREYRDRSLLTTRELSNYDHKPDERYSVRLSDSLDFGESSDLLIMPYTLGAWLGDGTSDSSGFTSADSGVVDRIALDGYEIYPTKTKYRYTITNLRPKLRELNVLNNKHIPEQYLRSSKDSRRELLQGLMDTDGTVDGLGTASFSNTNKLLAEQVYFLCHSLGLSPRFVERNKNINQSPYIFYEVRFQAYKKDNVFHLERKQNRAKDGKREYRGKYISSVKLVETVPTRCIQVDSEDGLYLVGHDFITTHNSTIITQAETIQYILNFPTKTTAIFSYTRDAAAIFFNDIKNQLETNEFLLALFPDILFPEGNPRHNRWNSDGICVKRRFSLKECTLEPWGLIQGMPTGRHFDRRIYDDISTLDLANSPDLMRQTKDKFDLSENIGKEGGTRRVIGTPYHHDDVLMYLRNQRKGDGTPLWFIREMPATEDGTYDGAPVLLSPERIEILKQNKRAFNSQQLLDPTPTEDRRLNYGFVNIVTKKQIPENLYKVMTVDPAGDFEKRTGKLKDRTDSWGIWVVGFDRRLSSQGNIMAYILDGFVSPMRWVDAFEKISQIYLRNGLIAKLGVEKVGLQSFETEVSNSLKSKGRIVTKENGRLVVLSPAGRSKQERIEGLVPPLEEGRINMWEGVDILARQSLEDEMEKFPFYRDDGLDALSYAFDLVRDYRFSVQNETEEDSEDEKARAIRERSESRYKRRETTTKNWMSR